MSFLVDKVLSFCVDDVLSSRVQKSSVLRFYCFWKKLTINSGIFGYIKTTEGRAFPKRDLEETDIDLQVFID